MNPVSALTEMTFQLGRQMIKEQGKPTKETLHQDTSYGERKLGSDKNLERAAWEGEIREVGGP